MNYDTPPEMRALQASTTIFSGFKAESDFAACLLPLLEALAWSGKEINVTEALPHFADDLDLTGLRNVMANLNYTSRIRKTLFNKLDARLLPCLFVPHAAASMVVLRLEKDKAIVFDGGLSEQVEIPLGAWPGTAILFEEIEDLELQTERSQHWFWQLASRFRSVLYQVMGLTLAMNILAFASPFFMMVVYDKIASTRSQETLLFFVAGTAIVLFADTALRAIKTYIIAFNSARIGNIIGNEVFRRILFLPPSFTERAAVGSQISRIKDFEVIRDFIASSAALTLLELPYIVITLAVIYFLGGGVAAVPLVMILLFFITGILIEPLVAEANQESSRAATRRQEFVIETLGHMRAVKYTGSVQIWQERYEVLTSRAMIHGFRAAQFSSLSHTLSHLFMMASGVATMAVGVILVLDKTLSTGGLVACMMLVWRVLGPLRSGFDALPRFEQVRKNILQLNKLMMLADERSTKVIQVANRNLRGAVMFDRVSMRYTPQADPSLLGVSLEIRPGEVIAVVGRNGAGRSTLLKLLMGLYQPQAGKILIDGQDVRQMNPMELRRSIGYVPQVCQLFFGTIAQNMRLANPVARDEDLTWAAAQVDLLDDILALPQGFRTRIGDSTVEQLPTAFRQRLNLARAFVKRPAIYLLDEPGNGLDFGNDQILMDSIRKMKGHATVIISTHRPSHMRLADRMVWLDAGRIKRLGPAAELLNEFMKDDS
ncbi:MAG: peptidase domain-containing ABC transporter [Magnetococcales bacterium]|nr:peptidase domain-containing ABC transporter [Magnetococcales bacterium]